MARPETTSRAPSVWCQVRIAGDGPVMPVGVAQRSGLANSRAPKATVERPRTRDRTGIVCTPDSRVGSGSASQGDGETLRNGLSEGIRYVGANRFDPGPAEDDVPR